MNNMKLLQQPTWRIIDQSSLGPRFKALQSFAMDDTLCTFVGEGKSEAVCRTWVHEQTVVLGIQDTRLPHLEDGLQFLQKLGYEAIVRNSGGLAVVLDSGVLNISLVLPEKEKSIDINSGYDTMWALIRYMFRDFRAEIEAREIAGSYCPGSYDLSIYGKKFAGISQRRIKGGVAVQIYLCVNKSGAMRAEIVKGLYERGIQGVESKFTFPAIDPTVMASLSELLEAELTVQDVMLRLLLALKDHSDKIYQSGLKEDELDVYEQNFARVSERNEKLLNKE
ncbi:MULTISPECIES: lipoate--protein ligase family protein [Bacillus]|uniref:lipoate--protein ligase family protein n=1 Tax=Bacillus TaxID=1386 RepID=UPI000BB91052|nr:MULTISPECIES: biotin/lipoate A/B protein ligase family protein [Bacillus]